jgi:predicted PurR-regulated permease PerM
LVAITILVAVIVALFNMLIPQLYTSIRDMVIRVPRQMNNFLNEWNNVTEQSSTLHKFLASALEEGSDYLQNWMKTDLLDRSNVIMTNLTAGVINLVKGILNFIIGIIISVYVLYSKELFSSQCKKIVYALMQPDRANMVLHVTQKSNSIFSGFISGKIIDSAIIGVLCFLGLTILDMPYTLLVSVIVGVTNVIPFFGPYIGAIPSALLILLEDPKKGLYFIIFIIVLQQLDGNVIGPKILGDSTGLSAFWVVFAILVSGGLFGIVGMLLGVPAFAVIYYIVTLLINHRLEVKNLPVSSSCYDEFSYVESNGEYIQSKKKDADTENNKEE